MRDDLVWRSQRGDEEAFAELVGQFQLRLYNLALRFLGDREDARDVVQEALTEAWIALPRLDRSDAFGAWISRITVNLCRNRERTRRRRPATVPADNVVLFASTEDPEAAAVRHSEQEHLQAMLLTLPAATRFPVILRDVNDFSYAEIADLLGIPVGTVRSRISRGRGELRRRLSEESGRFEPAVDS